MRYPFIDLCIGAHVIQHGPRTQGLRLTCTDLQEVIRHSRVDVLALATLLHQRCTTMNHLCRRLYSTNTRSDTRHVIGKDGPIAPIQRRFVCPVIACVSVALKFNCSASNKRARTLYEPDMLSSSDEPRGKKRARRADDAPLVRTRFHVLSFISQCVHLLFFLMHSNFDPDSLKDFLVRPKLRTFQYPFEADSDDEESGLIFKPAQQVNASAEPAKNPEDWFLHAGRRHIADDYGELYVSLGPLVEPLVDNWKAYRRREIYEGHAAPFSPDAQERREVLQHYYRLMHEWAKRFVLDEHDIAQATAAFPGWVRSSDMLPECQIFSQEDIFFSRGNLAELLRWDPQDCTWKHEFLPPRPNPDPRGDWKTYRWEPLASYGPWPQSY